MTSTAPGTPTADFNAPLYTPSGASPQGKSSIADSVQAYLDKGIPAEKIVLGMPLYGYAYQGVSSRTTACTAPTPPPSPSATKR